MDQEAPLQQELSLTLSPENLPTCDDPDPAATLPTPHPTSTLPLSQFLPSFPSTEDSVLHKSILFDCESTDSPLLARTFLTDPTILLHNPDPTTIPYLEYLSLKVLYHHTHSTTLTLDQLTAEWWCQIRPTAPTSRYTPTSTTPPPTGISFHYDKDEELHAQTGLHVHPHISTVTYLTNSGGPTCVVKYRLPNIGADADLTDVDVDLTDSTVDVIYPERGKHMSFDGRYLHGGDVALVDPKKFPPKQEVVDLMYAKRASAVKSEREEFKEWFGREARVTFLVNCWIHHRPICAGPIEGFYREAMVKVSDVMDDFKSWEEEFPRWFGKEDKKASTHTAVPAALVSAAATTKFKWEISVDGGAEVEYCEVDLPVDVLREGVDRKVRVGAGKAFAIKKEKREETTAKRQKVCSDN